MLTWTETNTFKVKIPSPVNHVKVKLSIAQVLRAEYEKEEVTPPVQLETF